MQADEKNSNSWWGKITSAFTSQPALRDKPSSSNFAVNSTGPKIEPEKVEVESADEKLIAVTEYPNLAATLPVQKKHVKVITQKATTQFQRFELRMARIKKKNAERKRKKPDAAETRRLKREILCKQQKTKQRRLALISENIEALRLKKMQCRNTWGRLEIVEWNKIMDEFIRTVLRVAENDKMEWVKQINGLVGTAKLKKVVLDKKALGSSFEFEVAAQMRALGWNVQFLGKSGDQGGDLLAQKSKNIVVLQCKNFAAKVGNGAVQEVVAAKQFYHASIAAVVSKNGFTRQAHQLADKNSVILLDVNQLAALG